jgi:hypothetical protein
MAELGNEDEPQPPHAPVDEHLVIAMRILGQSRWA